MADKSLTLTQTYSKSWTLNVQPLHWALLAYYAKARGKSRSETVRELVELVALRDKSFDPKAFKDFVTKELMGEEKDPGARDVLKAQVDEYVRMRKAG